MELTTLTPGDVTDVPLSDRSNSCLREQTDPERVATTTKPHLEVTFLSKATLHETTVLIFCTTVNKNNNRHNK